MPMPIGWLVSALLLSLVFTSCQSRQQEIAHLFVGSYSLDYEIVLFETEAKATTRNIFEDRVVETRTVKVGQERISEFLKLLEKQDIARWQGDYGSHSDPKNAKYLDPITVSHNTFWRLKVIADGKVLQSGGDGVFPSNRDPSLPSGPEPSDRFNQVNQAFNKLLEK